MNFSVSGKCQICGGTCLIDKIKNRVDARNAPEYIYIYTCTQCGHTRSEAR